MARDIFQGAAVDGNGRVVSGATITVYLAGGTTLATAYATEAGAALTGSATTSGTDGKFEFWVDHADYALTQRFKITIVLTDYVNKTFDDIAIYQSETITTPFITTLLDDANAATAQATLGVLPGTDVQPYDALLTAIAALTTAANQTIYSTGSDTVAMTALTAWARTFIANTTAAGGVADLGILELNNIWTANQNYGAVTLTDGATALDYATDSLATLALAENTTLGDPSNKVAGRGILLLVTNGATWTLSFNAAIDFSDHESEVASGATARTWYFIWTDGTYNYARRIWIDN